MRCVVLLTVAFITARLCQASPATDTGIADIRHAGEASTEIYQDSITPLGQTPPGSKALSFAPGLVNTERYTYGASFTPGMNEFHFLRAKSDGSGSEHVIYKYDNERWRIEGVSKRHGQPFFSPSGKRMHLGGRYRERTEAGWSEVQFLGAPYSELRIMRMTSSSNGTWVFDEVGSADGDGILRYSRLINGTRGQPEAFGPEINAGTFSAHPFIAPDESYLIWDARLESGFGDSDIYISFRNADGLWGKPINMGASINTEGWDAAASVTPDGKYLFFHRLNESGNANIYWVSADIIEALRPKP